MKGLSRLLPGLLLLTALWLIIHAVEPRLIPAPWTVAVRFAVLLPDPLWRHAGASLLRILAALLLAGVPAVLFGILAGRSAAADRIIRPILYLLYPVPKIALLPAIILLAGLGNVSKVLTIALVLFFQLCVAVRDAVRSIPEAYFLSVRSLGAGRGASFRYVILPALLPGLLAGLRIGTGTALAVLFFAETFYTGFGLGFFIMDSWMRIDYVSMFAGILAIALLGIGLFAVLDAAERLLCRWRSG